MLTWTRTVVLGFVLSVASVGATEAAMCQNDMWGGRSASIRALPNLSVEIAAQTHLIHCGNHVGCSGDFYARATLVGLGANCSSTNAQAHHDWQSGSGTLAWAQRVCDGLSFETYYYAGGIHWGFGEGEHYSDSPPPAIYFVEDPPPPQCKDDGEWCQEPSECCSYECGISVQTCGLPTPILVNLRGRVELTSPADGILFDFWGNGRPIPMPWPVDGSSAWLVLDRNDNGTVDDGGELFGNGTLLTDGTRAEHGFIALADLDHNRDGVVDRSDPAFDRLALWVATVRGGVIETSALVPLASAGIDALSVYFRESRRTDRWGNVFKYRAPVWFASGDVRFAYDVFFGSDGRGSEREARDVCARGRSKP